MQQYPYSFGFFLNGVKKIAIYIDIGEANNKDLDLTDQTEKKIRAMYSLEAF